MADFRFTTQGIGFYSLEPASRRAMHRAGGRAPLYYDDTRHAAEAAEGLLQEGYSVTLDGRELCLAAP